ncbi:MAG: lipoprotein LpqV, partial [Mycobacterium sp.]
RGCRYRPLVLAAVVVVAAVTAVAGCSAAANLATPSSIAPSGGPATREAAAALPPGVVGVSPAGVTTKVNVPARSTEGEYFQACHAAKLWMQGREGDRQALIEPYLATVQTPGPGGVGTWNTAWPELTPARQAAVIVAVQGAANDECG